MVRMAVIVCCLSFFHTTRHHNPRTNGICLKLYTGGGEEIAQSIVRPSPHGSLTVTFFSFDSSKDDIHNENDCTDRHENGTERTDIVTQVKSLTPRNV